MGAKSAPNLLNLVHPPPLSTYQVPTYWKERKKLCTKNAPKLFIALEPLSLMDKTPIKAAFFFKEVSSIVQTLVQFNLQDSHAHSYSLTLISSIQGFLLETAWRAGLSQSLSPSCTPKHESGPQSLSCHTSYVLGLKPLYQAR